MARGVDLVETDQPDTGPLRPVQHLRDPVVRNAQPAPALALSPLPDRLDLRPGHIRPQHDVEIPTVLPGGGREIVPDLALDAALTIVEQRTAEPDAVHDLRDPPTLEPPPAGGRGQAAPAEQGGSADPARVRVQRSQPRLGRAVLEQIDCREKRRPSISGQPGEVVTATLIAQELRRIRGPPVTEDIPPQLPITTVRIT